ncbi:hypothetical protein I4U23_031259 [Adineta vaga]|nr:hypothetical protein I4U23_031259 [Adineta vaga]
MILYDGVMRSPQDPVKPILSNRIRVWDWWIWKSFDPRRTIRSVLKENTVRLRGRNTASVITGQNGPITALKLPFYHSLRPNNAMSTFDRRYDVSSWNYMLAPDDTISFALTPAEPCSL